MAQQISLGAGSYADDSPRLSDQKLINFYVDRPQTRTITDAALKRTQGIEQVLSVSDITAWRGSIVMASIPYFVIGTTLYRLDRTEVADEFVYSVTDLGTVLGSSFISMATNGTQIAIVVPGIRAYTYTVADGLVQITDANFDGPVDTVTFINSYFVFTTSDGKKFINSPVGDGRGSPNGTAYDALDFSLAQADPDQIRGAINFNNILYILGSVTTQPFRTTARVPAPFVAIQGTVFNKGLSAVNSIVRTQNSFAFIGAGVNESPSIWEFTGNGFRKISTSAIDQLLSDLDDTALAEITSWSYAKDGAFFIGFSLPNTAIVFNSSSGRWSDRISTEDEEDFTYRAAGMVSAYGDVLVGDLVSGKIGRLKNDVYTEYGNTIKRRWVSRPFDNEGREIFVSNLEVVVQSGVGNSAVEDPQLRLSWSEDGETFTDPVSRSMGKVGERKRRCIWERQGMFERDALIALDFTDPSECTIIKVEAEIA